MHFLNCHMIVFLLCTAAFHRATCPPIDESSPHTALEEAAAAVTGKDAIVFATA